MGAVEDVLHRLIDAATGRANIGAHEADDLHNSVTPHYADKPLSAEEQAQLDALQKRAADAAAAAAQEVPGDGSSLA